MKKLIIALTVGVVAVYANAATVNWTTVNGYLYDGKGDDSSKITSGTAYLVVSDMYSQCDLLSEFVYAGGNEVATLAVLQARAAYLGDGIIYETATISGCFDSTLIDMLISFDAYFVIFNGDNMYMSNIESAMLAEEFCDIFFIDDLTESSKALPLDATKGYSSAGWYAVPEPTSGLLLLIGMAGLALKRKRACA